jgi:DNA-binding NarL/FixJ family response regulator
MKILSADDHAVVRKGVKQILLEKFPHALCEEATTAREVFEFVERETWDLLILDISLPDKSGLNVLKELKAIKPRLPVLMLTVHPEEEYAMRVFKSGGSGYLTKDSIPEQLVAAVSTILKGGKYVSPSLAEKMVLELGRSSVRPPHQDLSDREYQVMLMIASGKTLKEMADQLCLSPKTVSTYRQRLLEKMELDTNAALVRYAIENNLM